MKIEKEIGNFKKFYKNEKNYKKFFKDEFGESIENKENPFYFLNKNNNIAE